jgi:hypothetical protein
MKFADNERQTEIVQFRATPAEVEFLDQRAEKIGVSRSRLVRMAIDQFLEGAGNKGSRVSASKARPSRSRAKVKAIGKRSPSNSQSTEQ